MTSYTRLCAEDASFLTTETARTPMALGSLAIYDAKPLMLSDGSIDIDRLRRHVAAAVPHAACLRQRLAYAPLFNYPVWVDAEDLDLDFHITRHALPLPGSTSLLMDLAGRLHSQPLRRDRPLWEICVIEGLENDRFALLIRIHHALIDGGSGLDLMAALHSSDPDAGEADIEAWQPRPAPPADGLFIGELARRVRGVQGLAVDAVRAIANPVDSVNRGLAFAEGLLETAHLLAGPAPLNGRTGSRRSVHWFSTSVSDLKEIRSGLGGTLNDVVLAIAAGALRTYLRRDERWEEGTSLRVACPSNRRRSGDEPHAGNYTSSFLVDLPVHLADRMDRYRAVVEATDRAKASGQSEAVQTVIDLADRAAPELVGSIFALSSRFQNMVISNLAGPPMPLYMMGCEAQEIYPLTVLLERDALALTVFSYDGKMSWALCSDPDRISSLAPLETESRREFECLRSLAKGDDRGDSAST